MEDPYSDRNGSAEIAEIQPPQIIETKLVDCSSLIVKPQYETMYGEMSEAQIEQLKESVETRGQQQPITVNQDGIVIDGHQRVRVFRRLKRRIWVEVRQFKDTIEEKLYIHTCNLNRKDITDFDRITSVMNDEPLFREQARKRQLAGLRRGYTSPSVPDQADGDTGRTDDICAKWARVPRNKYTRVRNLIRQNRIPEQTLLDLTSKKITLDKVLRSIPIDDNMESTPSFIGERYFVSDQIELIRGHFAEIDAEHVEEESIKMIFPTVDCSEDNVLTRDLAFFAKTFLVNRGYLVLFVKQSAIGKVINVVSKCAKELDLMHVFPLTFPVSWYNPQPYVHSCDAMYLIFVKKVDNEEPEYQQFDFSAALSTAEPPADDNPQEIITPRDSNWRVIPHVIKSLDLGDSDIICDPTCGVGEAANVIVSAGINFIGIEKDIGKLNVTKVALTRLAGEIEQSGSAENDDEEEVEQEEEDEEENDSPEKVE